MTRNAWKWEDSDPGRCSRCFVFFSLEPEKETCKLLVFTNHFPLILFGYPFQVKIYRFLPFQNVMFPLSWFTQGHSMSFCSQTPNQRTDSREAKLQDRHFLKSLMTLLLDQTSKRGELRIQDTNGNSQGFSL